MSFGEFVTEWKKLKRQIRHKVSIGCKEGVPREQKSGWGREMWFNLPLLHTSDTSAWKRSWKSRRSFLCFISRLKIKNIQRKRSSECLYYSSRHFRCWKLHHLDHGGTFHGILNMCHNLSKNNKKQNLKESTREKKGAGQRRKVTGETNTSFQQSGKCFCKILPTAKTYFLFWLKKKRFSVSRK